MTPIIKRRKPTVVDAPEEDSGQDAAEQTPRVATPLRRRGPAPTILAPDGSRPLRSSPLRTAKAPAELAKTLVALRKDYGESSVISGTNVTIPWRIPLGIFVFDYATLGGLPHSRVTMFHGPKHSGKSTGALRALMGAQQTLSDKTAILVDVEGTHDPVWSKKVGVDNSSLLVVQPDTGEQAVDMTVALLHAQETSLIVVDSLAALLPIKEQEASAEDPLVAQQSRLITSMLRKVSAAQIKERKRGHHVTVLYTNQQRAKIGGWAPPGQEAVGLPGGKALGHFTSLEVRWRNKETTSKETVAEGPSRLLYNDHSFTIEKNKMNGGVRAGEFRMMREYDEVTGLTETEIDEASTMLAFAKRLGWYTGTPKGGYTLSYGEFSSHFSTADEAIAALYADRESMWMLRCYLIADHADKQGMPEWFIHYIRGGYEQ